MFVLLLSFSINDRLCLQRRVYMLDAIAASGRILGQQKQSGRMRFSHMMRKDDQLEAQGVDRLDASGFCSTDTVPAADLPIMRLQVSELPRSAFSHDFVSIQTLATPNVTADPWIIVCNSQHSAHATDIHQQHVAIALYGLASFRRSAVPSRRHLP